MAIRRTVLNWQKGFNRFWLLMTAVVAVGGFIAITVNPHNESLPESLQESFRFRYRSIQSGDDRFCKRVVFSARTGAYIGNLWFVCARFNWLGGYAWDHYVAIALYFLTTGITSY